GSEAGDTIDILRNLKHGKPVHRAHNGMHKLLGGGDFKAEVSPRAFTRVHRQSDAQRKFRLTVEHADGLRNAVFEHAKIVFRKFGDGRGVRVCYSSKHVYQAYVDAESRGRLGRRLWQWRAFLWSRRGGARLPLPRR